MATDALSRRLPTEDETEKASEAVNALSRSVTRQGVLPLQIRQDGDELLIELPPAVGELVLDVLMHVARGEMVTLVPYGAELTTQRAADLLNVSRPFLTKLLESQVIPFHKVGTHRRVRVNDLLQYKDQRDRNRAEGLEELQRLGQEYDATDG